MTHLSTQPRLASTGCPSQVKHSPAMQCRNGRRHRNLRPWGLAPAPARREQQLFLLSVSCSCSGPAQTPADQAASPVRPTALLSPSLVALREWCSGGTAATFITAAPTNFKHPQCTHCMLPVHICWPHHHQPVSLHHQPVMAALSKTTGNMSCLTRTLQIQQQMKQLAGLVL